MTAQTPAQAQTASSPTKNGGRKRRAILLLLVGLAAVLGGLAYRWEEILHAVNAMERARRVAVALAININE